MPIFAADILKLCVCFMKLTKIRIDCQQYFLSNMKVRKKAKIRNQYNQVLHLTQDTIWVSDKNTRKHHIQESQEVIPFPAGDHKAAMNRQDSMTDTKHK